MEGGKVVGLHDPPFNETPDQRTDSRMNDNFGDDEDWQGNEKSDGRSTSRRQGILIPQPRAGPSTRHTSSSGNHAHSVIRVTRRFRSSRVSPERCALRKI